MKKSSAKKPAATPAPVKKSAPVAKPAAVQKSAPVSRKVPAAPAVKKTVSKPIVTTISARTDVGFGNALYLRGEGPGLSWDKGVVMECTGEDQWTLVLAESARPVVFKFLRNDVLWSVGEDYTATPGATVVFSPGF